MIIISFYVPDSHLEFVKEALFNAGAGEIGNYQKCAWQTVGEGQFMPITGSNAFIGEVNIIKKVSEYKVEMVCDKKNIIKAIEALKTAHPYETPAYHIIETMNDFK